MVKFVKGNEAAVIGALYAGCDVYFGYPITPASEIAHKAAEYFPSVGRPFLQGECETAVAYMLYGAAATGSRAMTATSGPGMSLMQEGISYMAASQLPAVIVNIQRAGPGLGNVYPEQADYNQSVKGGGHGNYRCVVLAPGDVQEMCDLTIKAFELAFRYRTPAIILSDGLLGQMMEPLKLPETEIPAVETRDWSVQGTADTRKNLITSIFLDAPGQEALNQRLQTKYAKMDAEAQMAETYRTDDADTLLIAYGSSARVARSAVDELREKGVNAGLLRPQTLSPFPVNALTALAPGKKLFVVEMSSGQFRDDVMLHLAKAGLNPAVNLINHMGGVVITVDEVIRAVTAAH